MDPNSWLQILDNSWVLLIFLDSVRLPQSHGLLRPRASCIPSKGLSESLRTSCGVRCTSRNLDVIDRHLCLAVGPQRHHLRGSVRIHQCRSANTNVESSFDVPEWTRSNLVETEEGYLMLFIVLLHVLIPAIMFTLRSFPDLVTPSASVSARSSDLALLLSTVLTSCSTCVFTPPSVIFGTMNVVSNFDLTSHLCFSRAKRSSRQ